MRRSAMAGCTAMLLAAIAAGCQSPALAGRTQQRLDAINASLEAYRVRESGRVEKLRAMTAQIDRDTRQDAVSLQRDGKLLRREVLAERQRWQAKQPHIRSAIQKELAGKPERIEQTLPMLF